MAEDYSWVNEIADKVADMQGLIAKATLEAKRYQHLVTFTDQIDRGRLKMDKVPQNFIAHAAMFKLFKLEEVLEPYLSPDSPLRMVEEDTSTGWDLRIQSPNREYGVFRIQYQQLGNQAGKQTVGFTQIHITPAPEAEPVLREDKGLRAKVGTRIKRLKR